MKRIDSKNITKNNAFPLRYWALLSEMQVKGIENIVFTRDRVTLGVSRKEVIQVISDIVQAN